MNIVSLLGEQWVIGVVQLLLGTLIKPVLKDKLLATGVRATSVIPLINLFIAFLGFQILPASASAAATIAAILPVKEGATVFGLALAQTISIIGLHSGFKNTLKPAGVALFNWIFNRLK